MSNTADLETSASLEGIAIIGLTGRFPGAANVAEFWRNLRQGVESISFFTDEELLASGTAPAQLGPGFVRARGVLPEAGAFDAAFFGYTPREAEVMDPQQRVFLEAAWEALETAGCDPERFPGAIGVYAGMSNNTYRQANLQGHAELVKLVGAFPIMLANEKDYLATRVSYKLNLRGPSVAVQTACSTSLVAVCQACQSLLSYQCDLALAGGVAISFPQQRVTFFQEGGIASPDGHCRTFDARAAGTVSGEGVGVVVLKRLADAVADGDQVFAVIKGTGLNNDGSNKVGFSAPSVDGQAEAIALAQAVAGIAPETITYVEAHGTATPLGDPIEVSALTKAFRAGTAAKGFCGVGSVKSNIGHLDAAAGVAGLIKTVLALRHRELPPSLHYEQPNSKIDFANSPFYVVSKLMDWPGGAGPRRAGVSSFGMGGTNAHVVLEEAPPGTPGGPARPWQLLALSARTESALQSATANLARHLARHPEVNLADAAYTLHLGRREFSHRRVVVCREPADAVKLLETVDSKRVFSHTPEHRDPPVVFLFPGQGAQHVNMGLELYQQEPAFRAVVDQCAEILRPHLGLDLRQLLYPAEDQREQAQERLGQTALTQPALFVVEYALARLWLHWGVRPSAMIGHSVGEYVAACLAEVFSLEDALSLVAARGRLLQQLPAGAMLAVRLPEQEVLPLLGDSLGIAAVNSPNSSVVSGPTEAIAALQAQMKERGVACKLLATSHAFHSAMMDPIAEPFMELVRGVKRQAPQIPFISNVTATWITAEQAVDPAYWFQHLRQGVRFADGVQELAKEPQRILLEVGPGQILSTLARQHPARPATQVVLASLGADPHSEVASVLAVTGRLWLAGVSVDWQNFYGEARRVRVSLPTYPFERKHYFVAPPGVSAEARPEFPQAAVAAPAPVPAGDRGESSALVPVPPAPASSRPERILAELKSILGEVSGVSADQMDPTMSFMEMGFDSLFLTQASQAFESKLGVKVTFRQLLEELTTLQDLTTYLDEALPPEAFPAAAREQPNRGASPSAPATGPTIDAPAALSSAGPFAGPADVATIERLMQQQLTVTTQLLHALRSSPTTSVEIGEGAQISARAVTAAPRPLIGSPAAPGVAPGGSTRGAAETKPEARAIGPYRPLDKGTAGGLTEQQQQHLDALIARYTKRTPESKRMAQASRASLADPRTVSGFRLLWKEMVYPVVCQRSLGSKIWDVDGNEYVDLTMGFGVNLLGHSPACVVQALQAQLQSGMEIGPQSPMAGKLAELVREFTGMERVFLCNTGSEAVMAALRVVRTVTQRTKVVMFAGSYHGIFDGVLARPHKVGGRLHSVPVAPGIPPHMVDDVVVLDYDSAESLQYIRAHAADLAAVLVEPVQSRRTDLQPRAFLQELRALTAQTAVPLIFDEMISGFRCHPGGVQALFGIRADLATYGKIVGGGMPIGILAGQAKFLDALDGGHWSFGDRSYPTADMTMFAGTFVRHPLTLAAACGVLTHLKEAGPRLQEELTGRTARLTATLRAFFDEQQVPIHASSFSSWFNLRVEERVKHGALFFYHLREKGIHIWDRPSFMSAAHTEEDLERFIRAVKESVAELQAGGFFPAPPRSRFAGAAGTPVGAVSLPVQSGASHGSPVAAAPAAGSEIQPVAPAPWGGAVGPGFAPLTQPQLEIWLAAQLGEDTSSAYIESFTLKLSGRLNLPALQAAFQSVVDRHDALRTTFSPDGRQQQIAPALTFDIPEIDLTAFESGEREERAVGILDAETRAPFDLIRGPLLRVKLLKLEANLHWLVFSVHHIICDGWSVGVIMREVSALYAARCQGTTASLAEPLSYAEYSRRQWQQQGTPTQLATEAYWLRQFAGSVPVLDLPTDRPRPALRSSQGAMERLVLDRALYEDLKRYSAKRNCTLFATLLAGFYAWLHRLSGQSDLVVGVPAAGQSKVGQHNLVGHCVNLLPLRLQLAAARPFTEWLAATKTMILDGFDQQDCTFGTLIQKLKMERDPSRAPLVSVMFNVDKSVSQLVLHELSTEPSSNPVHFSKFDLNFNVAQTETLLRVDCTYNTDLFDAATMRRFLGYYQGLLAGVIAQPSSSVAALPLLTAAERQQMLEGWNDTAVAVPGASVPELFAAQVARAPDAVAVVCGAEQWTYGELNTRANRLAHHLRGLGVGPEQLVGIFLERSLELLVSVLAVQKAGAAYVPLDPAYPASRVALMLEDSGAAVIVTQAKLAGSLPAHAARLVMVDGDSSAIAQASHENPTPTPGREQLAYVLYTSGSTGRPKGVEIEQGALVNFLESMRRVPGFGPTDVLLAVTTLSFDIAGLELYLPLVSGGCVELASREQAMDAAYLQTRLASGRVTMLQATPVTWRLLLEAGWAGTPGLKVLCGGEAMPRDLAAALVPRAAEVWNMYGPTETTVWSTAGRVEAGREVVTVGRPIANTRVYVLDAYQQPVPVGVAGELYIGGSGVARGYRNRPDLTAEKFVTDPFTPAVGARMYRTGDLARFLADGQLEVLGRLDQQVKVRGFRIELGEIEAALSGHPAVREAVVLVRDGASGGRQLVAYVGTRTAAPAVADLRNSLKEKLPDYMVPTSFVFLESFPLTPNGKIDRKALPDPEPAQGGAAASLAPRTPTEEALHEIWSALLGGRSVGMHDNFFDLGGHSVLAIEMISRLRRLFKVELPVRALFEAPTIAGLAEFILRESQAHQHYAQPTRQRWNFLVPVQPVGDQRPFFLFPGGVGGEEEFLVYAKLARSLGLDQPFYGLKARGTDGGEPPHASVSEMAADYVKEIRTFQPAGPYLLVGECVGGVVAYEVARQLEAQGQTVGLLALLDSDCPRKGDFLRREARRAVRKVAGFGPLPLVFRTVERLRQLPAVPPGERLRFLREKAGKAWSYLEPVPTSSPAVPRAVSVMEHDYFRTIVRYQMQPYGGRITALVSDEFHEAGNPYGWQSWAAGGFEVHRVPGDHISYIREHVDVAAKQLRACLDQARAGINGATAAGSRASQPAPSAVGV